jgi:hypothetical protein
LEAPVILSEVIILNFLKVAMSFFIKR